MRAGREQQQQRQVSDRRTDRRAGREQQRQAADRRTDGQTGSTMSEDGWQDVRRNRTASAPGPGPAPGAGQALKQLVLLAVLSLISGAAGATTSSSPVEQVARLLSRRDVRALAPAVGSLYGTAAAADPELLLLPLSCTRVLSAKPSKRSLELGVSLFRELDSVVPRADLALGVLGLEILAKRVHESATVLPLFDHVLSPTSWPAPEEILSQSLHATPWLPWARVSRLRCALLQLPRRPPLPGRDSVLGLAMVQAVLSDRATEIEAALALRALRAMDGRRTSDVRRAATQVANATTEGQAFVEAARLLDSLCSSCSQLQKGRGAQSQPELDFLRGTTSAAASTPPPQLSVGWPHCRDSPVLQNVLASEAQHRGGKHSDFAAQILLAAKEGKRDGTAVHVLCLGDGDMSASALLAASPCLPLGSTVCATTLLSSEQFERLYCRGSGRGEANRMAVKSFAGGSALHGIDVSSPQAWGECLAALRQQNPSADGFDILVFNFPFADGLTNSTSPRQFDTHWLAKRRHQELIEQIFCCADCVLGNRSAGGAVVITLLLRQAVSWDVERVAAGEDGSRQAFRLRRAWRFRPESSYEVRRSNVDAPFPLAAADSLAGGGGGGGGDGAWSFEFVLQD